MAQKTPRPEATPTADREALIRMWLRARGSRYEDTMELPGELLAELEAALTEAGLDANGRPRTRKWVLIR